MPGYFSDPPSRVLMSESAHSHCSGPYVFEILSANSTLHFQKLLLRPPLPVSIIQLFFEACSTNILVQISPANSSMSLNLRCTCILKNSLLRFPLPVPIAGFVFKAFQASSSSFRVLVTVCNINCSKQFAFEPPLSATINWHPT